MQIILWRLLSAVMCMTVEGLLVGTVSGQGGCHRLPLQREGVHTDDVVVAYI